MGWGSSKTEAVSNATGQSNRAARRSQVVNQAQAGAASGRGRRRIGGVTPTRTQPSRKF